MWKYKIHDDGGALLRCDWDTVTFECYQGFGKWVEDPGGLGTWIGKSSDAMDYTTISEERSREVMKKIDDLVAKFRAKQDSTTHNLSESISHSKSGKFHHTSELIYKANEEDHFLELMNTCIDPKPIDPVEREEAVYPFLDELTEYLKREIGPTTTYNELKGVIREWIDEKIAQGPPVHQEEKNPFLEPEPKNREEYEIIMKKKVAWVREHGHRMLDDPGDWEFIPAPQDKK